MRKAALTGVFLLIAVGLFGQAISIKKDIAVFRLSYHGWTVPPRALARVDQQIEDVFVNIGRFNVIGMNYRLSEDDLTTFIEKLRELKQAQVTMPNRFSLGKEAFTEADLKRLVGSFVIVIPVLTAYSLHYEPSSGYTAELDTSFTFVSGETSAAIAHFSIRTIGVADTPDASIRQAASSIAVQLVYDIRSIPDFQLKTGIIEVNGSTVLIELGRTMGVKVGDEYAIITSRVLPSGHVVSDQTGLVVVKEVKQDISYAQIIYSNGPVRIGEQLKEIPRAGFESALYLHAVLASEFVGGTRSPVVTIGTLQTVTRGLYNFRPVLGVEIPFAATSVGGAASYGAVGLPLNLYLGGELNWRLGRFDVVPLAAVGIGSTVPLAPNESLLVSLVGGLVQLSLSYLVTPEFKAFVDLGYTQWLPVALEGWGGVYGGLGIAINY